MKYKLGDICEIVSGSTPKTSVSEYWDGNIKWITPAEISDDSYIISDSVRHITELGVKKTGLTPLPKDTVILSSRAPIGKVAIAGCEMYCNQGFKNLICSERINNRYLYWFLKGNTEYLNSLGRGATFKEISKQIVSEIQINVPDIQTQTEAVQAFEKVSYIIQMRKQQLAKLDELIKARFVEMFGTVHNNAYDYEAGTLESVSTDFFAGGDKPSDCSIKKDIEHPFPVYANGYENDGLQGYSSMCRVNKPSVTVSARGTIGYCFIRKAGFTPIVRLITIVPNEKVSVVYLKYAIDTMDIKSSGTSQAQLTVPNFKKERIIIPPLKLQEQFAVFVAQVDKSKTVVQKTLDKLETLKKALMQEYFG